MSEEERRHHSPCQNLVETMVNLSSCEAETKGNRKYIEDIDKRLREVDAEVGKVKRREVLLVGFATIGANILFKIAELLIKTFS